MKGFPIQISGLLVLSLSTIGGCSHGRASLFKRGEVARELTVPEIETDDALMQDVESELAQAAFTIPASTPPVPVQPTLVSLHAGDDLAEHLQGSEGPVLLDFHATWCGPCRLQGKILKEIESAAAQSGTRIIKIDVDEHPRIAKQYKVSSLPTLLMMEDGKVVQRQTGVADKKRLTGWMRLAQADRQ